MKEGWLYAFATAGAVSMLRVALKIVFTTRRVRRAVLTHDLGLITNPEWQDSFAMEVRRYAEDFSAAMDRVTSNDRGMLASPELPED